MSLVRLCKYRWAKVAPTIIAKAFLSDDLIVILAINPFWWPFTYIEDMEPIRSYIAYLLASQRSIQVTIPSTSSINICRNQKGIYFGPKRAQLRLWEMEGEEGNLPNLDPGAPYL